ncbi:hypothetical protein [Brucella haematophila]|jgi:hypothetical protein|uniref:hypothetical protein n=1 Tax=Brucella haematophila TaxID=419474 RepID=UPI00110EE56F|nr:hypothetical protein [Brucella haematophila]TMV06101.1 hypothetical protein FGI60_01950 [Brucella haematophila]
MQQTKPIRKQDWCLSAILSLIFGTATAFVFYYIVLIGVGDDGYAVIFCIFPALAGTIFGLWGLFYWRSTIALVGLILSLSPVFYLRFF